MPTQVDSGHAPEMNVEDDADDAIDDRGPSTHVYSARASPAAPTAQVWPKTEGGVIIRAW